MTVQALHNAGRASALPLSLLAQAIPRLTRHDLEALAERLIDRLDEIDGHPDDEDDDPAGQCDEDEANTSYGTFALCGADNLGAGCAISDEG